MQLKILAHVQAPSVSWKTQIDHASYTTELAPLLQRPHTLLRLP